MPEKLRAEGLCKRFGAVEVLKGVSLAAQAGDVIAMIGSSGSGKSTVLRCLNLLEKPNAGRIFVSGEELRLVPDGKGALKAQDAAQLQKVRAKDEMDVWHSEEMLDNLKQRKGIVRAATIEFVNNEHDFSWRSPTVSGCSQVR